MRKRTLQDLLTNVTNETGITFISNEGDKFKTYKSIYKEALSLLYCFQQKGIKAKDEIIFQVEDNEKFIIGFWACILGGIIPIPVNICSNSEKVGNLFNVLKTLKNPKIYCTDFTYNNFKNINLEKDEKELLDKSLLFISEIDYEKQGQIVEPDIEDTALIQFSSGSTGNPKGIELSHKNILTNAEAIRENSKMKDYSRALSWLPLTHNYGLIGIHIVCLLSQINIYLMPVNMFLQNPLIWMDKINQYRITIASSSNFAYKYFLGFLKNEKNINWDLSCLEIIVTGSEHISYDVVKQFLDEMNKFNLRENVIFPGYGMTESTLVISLYEEGEGLVVEKIDRESLSVGNKIKITNDQSKQVCFVDNSKPLNNVSVRICNDEGEILGEEYVGHVEVKSEAVMKGYYKNEQATQKSFTKDGWFMTGDIGFLKKGRLTIIGRSKDTIIKNGKNYYPQDVEKIIKGIDGLESVGVCACGVIENNENKIVAFIQYKESINEVINIASQAKELVFKALGTGLDDVVPIKMFPVTGTGKVRKFKLIDGYLNGEYQSVESILISNNETIIENKRDLVIDEVDKKIIDICSKILKVKTLKVDSNIFEFGMDSLKLANIAANLNKEFDIKIQLEKLFTFNTIEQIINYVKSIKSEKYNTIKKAEKREYYPISSQQKRLYAISQANKESTSYNISTAMTIYGRLDVNKFVDAFKKIIDRHESLRTSFKIIDNSPVQVINDNVQPDIKVYEITEGEVDSCINNFIKPFDLESESLVRIGLFRINNEKHIFVIDMHHIITDGTTMGIITKEFMELYNENQLKDVQFQYKDYSNWQNTMLDEAELSKKRKYWNSVFSDPIVDKGIPLDFKRPNKQSFNGDNIIFNIGSDVYKKLKNIIIEKKSSMYILSLSALSVLLYKYSNNQDILIGSPISGRTKTEFLDVAGLFVNTLVFRTKPCNNKTFSQFIDENKNLMMEAVENQDYQFEWLLEDLNIKKDPSRNPLFDIMLTMWNMDLPDLKIKDIRFEPYEIKKNASKVDISLTVREVNEDLEFDLNYCTDLFKEETMLLLKEHFVNILQCISDNKNIAIEDISLLSNNKKEYQEEEYENEDDYGNMEISFNF